MEDAPSLEIVRVRQNGVWSNVIKLKMSQLTTFKSPFQPKTVYEYSGGRFPGRTAPRISHTIYSHIWEVTTTLQTSLWLHLMPTYFIRSISGAISYLNLLALNTNSFQSRHILVIYTLNIFNYSKK